MAFKVTIKDGIRELYTLVGRLDVESSGLTLAEVRRVVEVEQFLERLTGYRFHIDETIINKRGSNEQEKS